MRLEQKMIKWESFINCQENCNLGSSTDPGFYHSPFLFLVLGYSGLVTALFYCGNQLVLNCCFGLPCLHSCLSLEAFPGFSFLNAMWNLDVFWGELLRNINNKYSGDIFSFSLQGRTDYIYLLHYSKEVCISWWN